MGTGAIYEEASEREASSRRPRRHGCAGPQNPFVPFDARDIEGSIVARFEAQVLRLPNALAVTDDLHRWSYGELNGFANRIGAEILRDPQPNEVPVALLFEHCAPAIAATLGVLKAGRCYVPLNTHQPTARIARMLEDSGARTIVTNDRNAGLAAETSDGRARIISIDKSGDERSGNLGVVNAPSDLAMILFTSGSTGEPKGVVHNHRNLLHNIYDVTNNLHVDASDRLTQFFSYDTAAGIPNFYASLLNGGSLHLFDIRARGFADLASFLANEKITIYHSVPQVFRHFAASLSGAVNFPELRLIRLGGEATSVADVELYQQHFSRTALLQVVFATTEIAPVRGLFIDGDTRLDGSIVPAGYEMPDVEVLILDDDDNEVAPGTAGRIAIRSEFLFCNYWRNPALTASVVTAGPDGRRTFRTGDRGMLIDDGCLIHLGRRDSMIKIGGHAVEVAEIEAVLLKDGRASEAAVVGRPDRSGETRLVAYVVGDASIRELRERLAQRLPSWMIPAAFVRMKSLPVNRMGKIDRAALPDPAPVRYGEHPPRDPLEVSLVAIWEELLQIRPVGIRDDFFQLGGDSLLSVELVTHIEAMFDRHVPVSMLAENPTVEQQAEILRGGNWTLQWPSIVPLQRRGDRPPIFFVPGAGSDVTSLVGFARMLGIEQPFYGLQPPGLDGRRRPARSVEELAAYFVTELRRAHPHGPYFLGGASYGGLVAFEMAQQLTRMSEPVAFLGLLDTHVSQFPRMRWGAPLRFWIFRRFGNTLPQSPDRSWESIAREIAGIWNARIDNRRNKLRRLPLTREGGYFDFLQKALRARRRYRIRPYPGKVTLFRYREQPSPILYHQDPLLGWGPTAHALEIVDVPGNHTNLTEEDAHEIFNQLRVRLHAAQDAIRHANGSAA